MSFEGMTKVAKLEFSIMIRNPVVLAMLFVLLAWAALNAADGYVRLHSDDTSGYYTVEKIFTMEYNNFPFFVATNVTFLSLCFGVLSIIGDRSSSRLRLLLTKPLYRKDLILGKIIGLDMLLFLIIAVVTTLFLSFQLIAIGGTGDIVSILLRTILNILIIFIYSSLVTGFVLLFSMIFRSNLLALIASVSFVYLDAHRSFSISTLLGIKELMWIIPYELLGYIIHFNNQGLQSITQPLDAWLIGCWPYIVLLCAETVIVILLVIILFNREEA